MVVHGDPCAKSQIIQALAANGRGVGVVTDLPRYGLYGVLIQASPPAPELNMRLPCTVRGIVSITAPESWKAWRSGSRTFCSVRTQARRLCLQFEL